MKNAAENELRSAGIASVLFLERRQSRFRVVAHFLAFMCPSYRRYNCGPTYCGDSVSELYSHWKVDYTYAL